MITIRPRLDEDLVRRIKMKHPKETMMATNEETITWAINQYLKEKA